MPQASGELEDLDDIFSPEDDEWAAQVRALFTELKEAPPMYQWIASDDALWLHDASDQDPTKGIVKGMVRKRSDNVYEWFTRIGDNMEWQGLASDIEVAKQLVTDDLGIIL